MSTTTDDPILTADDVLADVRSTARAMIRGGSRSFDQVLSRALELAALADDVPRAGTVERVVAQEWDAAAAALAGERGASDDVRVEHAFANLEHAGISARLGWSCCQDCGERDLLASLPDGGAYAFVTEPDLERLAAGTLVVRCSSSDVGRAVAGALAAQGLDARDDGATVVVRVTAWRRRPPRASAA
jgi:hypothetical protein